MKFDLMGIVFMIVAIALAQLLSGYLSGYLGSIASGFVGVIITGLIAYAIYTFITKGKFSLISAVIFAVLIYVAIMGASYIEGMLGVGGEIITYVVAGVLASLLWGWIGGKTAGKGKGLKL